jgi:hypothetical protein
VGAFMGTTKRSLSQAGATTRLPPAIHIQQLASLHPPLLFGREEQDGYDQLFARLSVSVKPVDFIEEMFVSDIASLQWEIMELRQLKLTFTKSIACEALESFLGESLPFKMYEAEFKRAIQRVIDETPAADEPTTKKHVLGRCMREEPGAAEELNEILSKAGRNALVMYLEAMYAKAEALARSFMQGDATALKQIRPLLSRHRLTLHDVVDPILIEKLDTIDRINRLMLGAETLRNATLREIDRRRARLGASLRRTLEAEDATLEDVATSPETKNAA